jgi:chitinase
MKPGKSHLLEASVLGSENSDIGWLVQEGNAGGSIVPSGASSHAAMYTAPATVGVYHVIASSKADETRTATATIEVRK